MRTRLLIVAGLGVAIVAGVAAWLFYSKEKLEPLVPLDTVEAAARFTSIEGGVEVRKRGQLDWIDASMRTVLLQDDLVRTGKNAVAQLKFADGTEFALRPDSLLTILKSPGSPDSKIARVEPRIDSGGGHFQTGEKPDTGISGPNSRTTPDRETQGRIQVDEGGTEIEIRDGGALVETDGGQQVRLSPNEGVQIDAEGVAGPKTTLPPAPVVMDVPRPPGLQIRSVDVRGDQLHLRGRTEPGVTLSINGERVQVQRDGSFREHVVLKAGETEVVIRATSLSGAVTEQRIPIVVSR